MVNDRISWSCLLIVVNVVYFDLGIVSGYVSAIGHSECFKLLSTFNNVFNFTYFSVITPLAKEVQLAI